MVPKKKDKMKEQFATYLSTAKILIADQSSASRVRLANILIKLGAKANQIAMHGQYESAQDYIKREHPKVILSDYYLGTKSGFDLILDYKSAGDAAKDTLFILVTGNSSQSAVARAAEEDVDTFVLKPYTLESLEETITRSAIQKFYPSEYMKKISEGKELLFNAKPSEAKKIFSEAQELDSKPALACFYYGQAEQMENALDSAKENYDRGLGYNNIHFKCLVSLFDLLMDQKKHVEAYEVVSKIAKYFPANPKRLGSVIRLAITTCNFEDIEKYYQMFTGLDERTDELVRYICSGLIVTGKWYLKNRARSRALELFEKAGVSSAGQSQFLQFIIENLIEFNMVSDAEKYLKRFHPEEFDKAPYIVSKYMISDRIVDPLLTIHEGREILKKGIYHPNCYKILLTRLAEMQKAEELEQTRREAIERFPNKKPEFEPITIESMKKSA